MGELFDTLPKKYYELLRAIRSFAEETKTERAKEFLLHGVGRRLVIINRCIVNIFTIFPPERIEKLADNERHDANINLHAFQINIYGIIDNLGLCVAYEKNIIDNARTEKEQRHEVGLFKTKFLKKLNGKFYEYFSKGKIKNWFKQYASDYRHALAHRIPAYIPPAGINEEEVTKHDELEVQLNEISKTGYLEQISAIWDKMDQLGKATPLFTHSFSEKSKIVLLHPQLLVDFLTIEEIINFVLTEMKKT